MLSPRKMTTALATVIALALSVTAVQAQQAVTLDFAGGVGVPAGDLADFQEYGPAFDIGLNVQVHDRFSLRASGGASILAGKEIENAFDPFVVENGLADMSTVHFDGGGVVHLTPDSERFTADLNAGAGVSILTSERQELTGAGGVSGGTAIIDISDLFFDVTAGLDVGYRISEQVSAFAGADGHLMFIDETDDAIADLGLVAPNLEPPSSGLTIPVAAGLRFHFQP